MKKLITLFFLVFTLLVNAQVKIPAPIGYSFTAPVEQRVLKSVYNYGNLIFAVAYQDGFSTNALSLFKINMDDSSVTQIQLPSGNFTDLTSFYNSFKNLGAYNNKLYFQSYNSIYEINLNNNICSFLFNVTGGYTNYCLYNGKIYYQDKYYDLNTNQLFSLYSNSYPDDTNYFYNSYFTIFNNELYAIRFNQSSPWANPFSTSLIKINSSNTISVLANPNGLITLNDYFYLPSVDTSMYDFEFIGNKIILQKAHMTGSNANRSLIAIDLNTLSENVIHSNTIGAYYDVYLKKDNLLYFRPVTAGYNLLRTDGSSVTDTGIPEDISFVYVNNEDTKYSRFKLFNNTIIGSKRFNDSNGYQQYEFFKSNDLALSNITVLNSCSNNNLTPSCLVEPKNMIEYNGNLYFHNWTGDWGVFKYDGVNFTKLNISTTNEIYQSQPLGDAYAYNNFLFYSTNIGLFKIDLSTAFLSTQNITKLSLKLYPNPTKSTLNFSEELSEITIVDLSGKQVVSQKEKAKSINVEKLPKGNYLFTAIDKNGKIVSQKFIKE